MVQSANAFHHEAANVSYQELTALLNPGQFEQLQVVREHLLQDPTAMDRSAEEETSDGNEEGR